MLWQEGLKQAGVNIHLVATGAAAGLQDKLWSTPGSSAYLSGATFPYATEEQEELLGFMPDHFCSKEAAVDLASAAYMKAYKFGGKKPIGMGITASVASEKVHHGDHRVFLSLISDEKVSLWSFILEKDAGSMQRHMDGCTCDQLGLFLLMESLNLEFTDLDNVIREMRYTKVVKEDASELARQRFMARPFFSAEGKRLGKMPDERFAIMPGAYNPPHEGHFGMAKATMDEYNYRAVFEITAVPPHKEALTVQQLLQRAKLLQGHNRLFTEKLPFYLDKARKFPGKPLVLGADAMVRMLDPKWGIDMKEMFGTFYDLGNKLFVCNREVDGVMTTCEDILDRIKVEHPFNVWASARIVMVPLEGEWNVSSTELRNKLK